MGYVFGQFLGLLSTVCTIILPFFKKKWQILCTNIAINLLVALNLILIGQFGSACCLCAVAVVQSIVSLFHNPGHKVSTMETVIFTVLYVGFGFLGIITAPGFLWAINLKNLLELLPILGALALMISVFSPDEQTTRKWLLVNASVWTVYSGMVGSTVFFTDLLAVISTTAALYKYRKREKNAP